VTEKLSPAALHNYVSAVYKGDKPFDVRKLDSVIGTSAIAAPLYLPLRVEEHLKQSGRYRPSFYCFYLAVLDDSAEDREINDVNQSDWLLIPFGVKLTRGETPESSGLALGWALPYHAKREPYLGGSKFYANLEKNWELVSTTDGYGIFRRKM
jgi:hypothetical protein